jgi:hypothetical protein
MLMQLEIVPSHDLKLKLKSELKWLPNSQSIFVPIWSGNILNKPFKYYNKKYCHADLFQQKKKKKGIVSAKKLK